MKRDKAELIRLVVWVMSMVIAMNAAVNITEKYLNGGLIAELLITFVLYVILQAVIILVLSLKNKTSFREEMHNWPQKDPDWEKKQK